MKIKERTALQQLEELFPRLPTFVAYDINFRLQGYPATDGNDPYIKQQLRYAENVIRSGKHERN